MYRIHELPDPKRILDFEEVAGTYGQTLGFSFLPVKKLHHEDRTSVAAGHNVERHGMGARRPAGADA